METITTLLYPEKLWATMLFPSFHSDATQEQRATADVACGLLSIKTARLLCLSLRQRGVWMGPGTLGREGQVAKEVGQEVGTGAHLEPNL